MGIAQYEPMIEHGSARHLRFGRGRVLTHHHDGTPDTAEPP
jgi:hypothetical protein